LERSDSASCQLIMYIGISTASFFGKAFTEDSLRIIEGMGVKCAEVFLTTFREYLPEFGALLKERKGCLEAYSVHTLNQHFEPELFSYADRTREDAEFFFREAAEVGKTLGAKYYTFHGPARLKKRAYILDYKRIGAVCDGLDGILSEYGMRLTYENVHWTYFNSPEFFTNLKKQVK